MVSLVNMRSLSKAIGVVSVLFVASPSLAEQAEAAARGRIPISGEAACHEGKTLAEAGESVLAHLYLERCHRSTPTPEVRELMYTVRGALRKETRASAPVSLALTPSHATATLVGKTLPAYYAGNPLLNEDELWLPKGHYEIEVKAEGYEGGRFAVDVESVDRMLVPITLREAPKIGPTEIDMSEERGSELGQVASAVDPRPKEFETLLAKRYRRAPTPKPIPESPVQPGPGPWPYISAGLGIVAMGSAITLHTRGHSRPALAGYATGALLGGAATYLFLRDWGAPARPRAVSVSVGPGRAILGWQRDW